MQQTNRSRHRHMTSFQVISLGFLSVILLGSLLLMLPIATKSGQCTSFLDALFTATSAVCVTGLVINDTATTEIYTLSLHDALPICDCIIRRNIDLKRLSHSFQISFYHHPNARIIKFFHDFFY